MHTISHAIKFIWIIRRLAFAMLSSTSSADMNQPVYEDLLKAQRMLIVTRMVTASIHKGALCTTLRIVACETKYFVSLNQQSVSTESLE